MGQQSAHPLFRTKRGDEEDIAWFTSHNDGKRYYAALFNAGGEEREITAQLPFARVMEAYDIWQGKSVGTVSGSVKAVVKPHGAVLYRLTVKD